MINTVTAFIPKVRSVLAIEFDGSNLDSISNLVNANDNYSVEVSKASESILVLYDKLNNREYSISIGDFVVSDSITIKVYSEANFYNTFDRLEY